MHLPAVVLCQIQGRGRCKDGAPKPAINLVGANNHPSMHMLRFLVLVPWLQCQSCHTLPNTAASQIHALSLDPALSSPTHQFSLSTIKRLPNVVPLFLLGCATWRVRVLRGAYVRYVRLLLCPPSTFAVACRLKLDQAALCTTRISPWPYYCNPSEELVGASTRQARIFGHFIVRIRVPGHLHTLRWPHYRWC